MKYFVSIDHPLTRADDGEAVERDLQDGASTAVRNVGVSGHELNRVH